MKALSAIGHFAFGKKCLDGQTVKTNIVTDELAKILGNENVVKFDTSGGVKRLIALPFAILKALKKSKNVIIFPAQNGLKVIVPLLTFFNRFFKRTIHYSVIGGWLPDFLNGKKALTKRLKKLDYIYVETNGMKNQLEKKGFNNVSVVPNCKNLDILDEQNLVLPNDEPYKLCTFSRVSVQKGIEDAVNAVKSINNNHGKVVFALDIYGQVDSAQTEWFDSLKNSFPEYIRYCGVVDYDNTTNVIKDYCALLFPTYYEGEGFAGTLIDAMAAGVPVVASDWKYNSEVVVDGVTGLLYQTHNQEEFVEKIEYISNNLPQWIDMKKNAIVKAKNYLPGEVVIKISDNMN